VHQTAVSSQRSIALGWLDLVSFFTKNIKLLLGFSILAGGVAAFVSWFVLTPQYSSTALIFILPDRIDVSFDPKFRNLPEDRVDLVARRRTMEMLINSEEVVGKVIDRLRGKLTPYEQNTDKFREMFEVGGMGEILKITAVTRDPALSAELADTLAIAARDLANSSVGPRDMTSKITEERAKHVLDIYQKAQEALVEFSSRQERSEMLGSVLKIKRTRLEEMHTVLLRLEKGIKDCEAIIEELKTRKRGGNSLEMANVLSILVLRLDTLESSVGAPQPFQLQMVLGGSGGGGSGGVPLECPPIEDLSRLLEQLRKKSDSLRVTLSEPKIHAEILEIQGEVEHLTAKKRELTAARDLAWETYITISRKVEESRLAAEGSSSVVRLASHAVQTQIPERTKRVTIMILGTLGGLIAGVFYSSFKALRSAKSATLAVEGAR
jgi:capsular polysaccharide biosynthesis protein